MSEDLKAWPFKEAQKIEHKINVAQKAGKPLKHEYALLETGFGPSGLPHLGTFAEVARTTWVRYAFEHISDRGAKLLAFSDDMDGLRKVPENMPNREMIAEYLGKPLCDIPDPFGEAESFSGYMNAKLRSFLDSFGLEYDFLASSTQYRGGVFNEGLLRILERYDAVRDLIVPTLKPENREAWSPFFPVCENCAKVYSTRVTAVHPEDGTISYACDQNFRGIESCGHTGTIPVTDGNVKVGWKVDWALRWYVFDVDYEMYGKDLIDSADLSSKIVRVLGGQPPVGFFYEMFLDENGAKISKSVGSGLTIDEWLQYGPLESLSWFIFQNPTKAKKLHFDVIPKSVDDYLDARRKFGDPETRSVNSPIWFIEHEKIKAGQDISYNSDISYSMLLNLVNVLNSDDKQIVWNYILRYDENAKQDFELIDDMIDRALRYYRDFILPTKEYERPTPEAMPAVEQLLAFLETYEGSSAEELQSATYAAGKENGLALPVWFRTMYRLLLGQERGPRLGTFIHLYGVKETRELIKERLNTL